MGQFAQSSGKSTALTAKMPQGIVSAGNVGQMGGHCGVLPQSMPGNNYDDDQVTDSEMLEILEKGNSPQENVYEDKGNNPPEEVSESTSDVGVQGLPRQCDGLINDGKESTDVSVEGSEGVDKEKHKIFPE